MRPPFSSEQTLVGHGVYLAAVGLLLFFEPGLLRLVLPFPAEFDWWNRILALPLFNLGLFCLGVAWTRSPSLVTLSVATRLLVMAAIATLVATGRALPIALVVGVIDVVSAALTLWAVTSERRS